LQEHEKARLLTAYPVFPVGAAVRFFVFGPENTYNRGNPSVFDEIFCNEKEEDMALPKPSSIRTAEWLIYVKLALSLIPIVMNIMILVSPSMQQRYKVNMDQLTAGQVTTTFIFLIIPAVAAVLALWFIRRRQRIPAILASLVILFFSTSNFLQMIIGLAIVVMLFTRSSKAYFSVTYTPQTEQPAPEESDAATEEERSEQTDTRPFPRLRTDPVVQIRPAGADEAETIHTLMMEAFEEYRAAVPPSSALDETLESVREKLEAGQGAAILYEDERPVAMVRYEIQEDAIYFFRLSVIPSRRRRGYSKQLVRWIEQQGRSKGLDISRCKVRQTVQNNVAMYQDMGYEIVDQELVVMPAGSVKALKLEKKLLV
jgi:ribosomal protein S18 acetylase RimI-like enzyme